MVLDFMLDPILIPLLRLPSLLSIAIISFVITLIVTLVYRKFTDQSLMKSLKQEIKGYQEEMKKYRDDPQKLLKIQKKAMDANLKYMSHSFKPTLITLIPILLIFGWLNAHFTYQPLIAGEDFFVTAQFDKAAEGAMLIEVPQGFSLKSPANQSIKDSKIEWKMSGPAGNYVLKYTYDQRDISQPIRLNKDSSDKLYEKPVLIKNDLIAQGFPKDTKLKSITIGNQRTRPFGTFNLWGWFPGWLATYIILSIIFSIGMRKVLDVH